MYGIMAKKEGSKKFRRLNYGTPSLTDNPLYQTLWEDEQKGEVQELVDSLNELNRSDGWIFKMVKVPFKH
jgi:hypothetical protein